MGLSVGVEDVSGPTHPTQPGKADGEHSPTRVLESFIWPLSPEIEAWRQPYTPGLLSKVEFEQYWEKGYVVKREVFKAEELQPALDAVDRSVDEIAEQLFNAGKISNLHKDKSVYTRLTEIEKEFPSASVLLHKKGVLPPEFQRLWTHPKLLSAAHQVLGGDLAGHPVWNLRPKTPGQEQATVPWHQDTAYLHSGAWQVHQLTAWVPLVNATTETGCMQVMPGGHRAGKTVKHTCCAGGTWYVEMDIPSAQRELHVSPEDVMTCEVPLGGVLFLNNLIPHRSLNNVSKQIRWSLDLRWQRPDQPCGFYGIKDVVLMTKSGDPAFTPDWDTWAPRSRVELQEGRLSEEAAALVKEVKLEEAGGRDVAAEFDTTISGPWMDRWEMTHHNRHTAKHQAGDLQGWHKA